MAKMNWDKVRSENHAAQYGLVIDYSVGAGLKPPVARKPKKRKKKKNAVVVQKVKIPITDKAVPVPKPSKEMVSSSRINELMECLRSQIALNHLEDIDKTIKELRTHVKALEESKKSQESLWLTTIAHNLMKKVLIFKSCANKKPERAILIAEDINSTQAP